MTATLTLPNEGPTILVRPGIASDAAFVFDTWLKHYRLGELASKVQGPIYYREQRALARRILERPTTLMVVAADPEAADHIFGWLVAERPGVEGLLLVHYTYVKAQFRRFGLAKAMLGTVRAAGEELVATHFPPKDPTSLMGGADALLRKAGAVYNPFRC